MACLLAMASKIERCSTGSSGSRFGIDPTTMGGSWRWSPARTSRLGPHQADRDGRLGHADLGSLVDHRPDRTAASGRISSGSSRRSRRDRGRTLRQPRAQAGLMHHHRPRRFLPANSWPCRWQPDCRAGTFAERDDFTEQVLDGRVCERGDQHAERSCRPSWAAAIAKIAAARNASCRCPAAPTPGRHAAGKSVESFRLTPGQAERGDASSGSGNSPRTSPSAARWRPPGSRSKRRNSSWTSRPPCGGSRPRCPS